MSKIIRLKGTIDGSTTLAEAALRLRAVAADLDNLHARGWRLDGPAKDDCGTIYGPGEESGGGARA